MSSWGSASTRQRPCSFMARSYHTEAFEGLVQLYEAWGKKDQAERWPQKRDAARAPGEPPKEWPAALEGNP